MTFSRSTSRRAPAPRPGVVFQPDLLAGIDLIANATRVTLGPLARAVAVERNFRHDTPEIIDDAGIIARRVIQIADADADAGAMMLRHALWRMRERFGDGAATLAAIAQHMAHGAVKAVAAGMHPALLRKGIETGAAAAVDALRAEASTITGGARGRAMLRAVAVALCKDVELRDALAQSIEIIGAEGGFKVINHQGRNIVTEYVEGSMWDVGWQAPGFASDLGKSMARIEDTAVAVLRGGLNDAQAALRGLQTVSESGRSALVLVADGLGEAARDVFYQAHSRGLIRLLPLKAPYADAKGMLALQDICTLTGASMLYGGESHTAGGGDEAFASLLPEQLGFARRVWADADRFGIIGGARDPQRLRAEIARVRRQLSLTSKTEEIDELRARLGRLHGGLAMLRVGGDTSQAADQRRDEARRLASAMQAVQTSGVVAGGGAALARLGAHLEAAAMRRIKEHAPKLGLDELHGEKLVAQSLSAPLLAIAENCGHDSGHVLGQARAAKSNVVFNARTGALEDMIDAGVADSVDMLCGAIQIAASLVAMQVTTDAIVLRKSPPTSANP